METPASGKIEIVRGDVRDVASDLLVLKYADGFHGADKAVAEAIGFSDSVPKGDIRVLETPGHPFRRVMFIGTGPLFGLYYDEIRDFGFRLAREAGRLLSPGDRVTTTLHGVGVGLDERQALLSEVQGIHSGAMIARDPLPRIAIVEWDEPRVERLRGYLDDIAGKEEAQRVVVPAQERTVAVRDEYPDPFSNIPFPSPPPEAPPATPPTLFVAMPFADEYLDEYDISFVEAAHENDFLCERLDLEAFTGDVMAEMERRIRRANGVIALMNGANPNVFLEIGYALALDKPLILVAKAGQPIPFDVRNMRRITYGRIAELRDLMRREIAGLSAEGIL